MRIGRLKRNIKTEYKNTFKENKEHSFKFKPRYLFVPLVVAFALFLIINHIYVLNYNSHLQNNLYTVDLSDTSIIQINNEDDVKEYILSHQIKTEKKSVLQRMNIFGNMGCKSSSEIPDITPTDPGEYYPTDINGSVNKGDVTDTNVQVEGIDEEDVCKCDGKYFYLLSTGKQCLMVYDLKGNVIATTRLNVSEYDTNLYIYKNKIVVKNHFTEIYSLDGNKLTLEKTIDKYSVETRLANGVYYSISKEGINKIKDIDYGCYYDGYSQASFIYTITSYNLDTMELKSVKIVEGSDCDLYMSENNIYLASTTYIYYEAGEMNMFLGVSLTSVSIFDYSLEAKGTIKLYGKVRNQFSMDEYNGYFRIVSTNNTYDSEKINSLYVYSLNDLSLVGSLENEIGEDYQEIKSVTFNGNTCYCVTYRNTDPLYEIDLTDPTKPVITSVLRTPGYSGYMYKFMIDGKLYILGLGYSDSRIPKISVYDATNGENTQVGKTFDFKYNSEYYEHENGYPIDCYDEIDWLNHKSLLIYNDGESLYVGKKITRDKYVIFKIDVNGNEVISVYKEIANDYVDTENRGFLINGVVYVVDGSGVIAENLK